MYRRRFKHLNKVSRTVVDNDVLERPCVNLGTQILNQIYHGVDAAHSTLLQGQFDPADCDEVDPAVDMRTDRFTLELKELVPTSPGEGEGAPALHPPTTSE